MTKRKKERGRILLDADYMVYSAGFAAQHTDYLVTTLQHNPVAVADSKSGVNEQLAEAKDDPTFLMWERTTVEPVENALHTVKLQLNHIKESVEDRFGNPADLEIYLTGTGNFREKIATIKPYKGNRAPWHKPRLYREIRAYLIDQWGAKVIHDREADDQVCIEQAQGKGNTVIAGIDKDLLQCPGWHYNADKDAFAYIDETLGTRLLYRQILSGDATDNVGGCYKLGVTKAKKLVDTVAETWKHSERRDNPSLARRFYNVAVEQYAHSIDRYGDDTGYAHMTPEEAVRENARLVYMLRSEDDEWREPE